jgi:hypothetical protein
MSETWQSSDIDLNKVSFQNFKDDTTLDGYSLSAVWTRSPRYTNQVWQVTYIGKTHTGEKMYTITMIDPTNSDFKGMNLEATDADSTVRLAAAEPNKVPQRWIMRLQDDRTAIQSMKHLDYVLTGQGTDVPVKLLRYDANGNDAQMWTPFNKEQYFVAHEDPRYEMESGV